MAATITIAETAEVSDWTVLNPLSSPKILAATLAVLIARTREVPIEQAMVVVFKMSPAELLDCVEMG